MIEQNLRNIIKRLFELYNLKVVVDVSSSPAGAFKADMIVRSTESKAVVEIKFYRSRWVAPTTIFNAAKMLEQLRVQLRLPQAILVMTARVDPLSRANLATSFPALTLYDYDTIAYLMRGHPQLADQFRNLIQSSGSFDDGRDDIGREPQETMDPEALLARSFPPVEQFVAPGTEAGRLLCEQIREIANDTSRHSDFEKKCVECLKYLFQDDFTNWIEQKSSDNGLHRFDLIARIKSKSGFWNQLSTDFGARYVVFEFKCYNGRVTQKEIYSTEKYLHTKALRSIAIIISPLGANENATMAALGALRENGKVIINISLAALCQMLHAKDGADITGGVADVEEPLFRELDSMLMSIER